VDKNNVLKILKKADFNISDIKIEREEKELNKQEKDFLGFVGKFLKGKIKEEDLDKAKVIKEKFLFGHRIKDRIYYLNYEEESAGTQRFFQLAVILDLMMKNSFIFPIDEIEASLHPDLI